MGFLINLVTWSLFGLVVGAVARLLVPGHHGRLGCLGTIILGIAGSVFGGFLGSIIFGEPDVGFQPAGFIGAVIGGVLILILIGRIERR